MVRLKTVDIAVDPYPAPIPAPFDPSAVISPLAIVIYQTPVELPLVPYAVSPRKLLQKA
jgi:hypothetical protein